MGKSKIRINSGNERQDRKKRTKSMNAGMERSLRLEILEDGIDSFLDHRTKKEVEELGKTLTEEEFNLLVDLIVSSEEKISSMSLRVDKAKCLILDFAKAGKWVSKEGVGTGSNIVCTVKSRSSTTVNSKKALALLRKEGKSKLFEQVFKVQIAAFKKYLGEDLLSKVASVGVQEYASITCQKRES